MIMVETLFKQDKMLCGERRSLYCRESGRGRERKAGTVSEAGRSHYASMRLLDAHFMLRKILAGWNLEAPSFSPFS